MKNETLCSGFIHHIRILLKSPNSWASFLALRVLEKSVTRVCIFHLNFESRGTVSYTAPSTVKEHGTNEKANEVSSEISGYICPNVLKCTTLRVISNVNCGLWVTMMCQYRFIDYNKCTPMIWDNREVCSCVGRGRKYMGNLCTFCPILQ